MIRRQNYDKYDPFGAHLNFARMLEILATDVADHLGDFLPETINADLAPAHSYRTSAATATLRTLLRAARRRHHRPSTVSRHFTTSTVFSSTVTLSISPPLRAR